MHNAVMKLPITLYLHLKRQPHKPSVVPPKFLCYEALRTGALGNLQRPEQPVIEAGKLVFTLLKLLARWLASEKLCPMQARKDPDNLTSLSYRTDLLIKELHSHRDSLFYTLLGNTHTPLPTVCVTMLLQVHRTAQTPKHDWPYYTPTAFSAWSEDRHFLKHSYYSSFPSNKVYVCRQTRAFYALSFQTHRLAFWTPSSLLVSNSLIPLCIVFVL